MKKTPLILFFFAIILVGCKSNQEAYNSTYRKLKEKEELQEASAKTAMDVPKNVLSRDSTQKYPSEKLTLILGKVEDLSTFSIVARSFINRTNARGFFTQMVDKGYKAILIQNEERMYRIAIASFSTGEEADAKLIEIRKTYPEAFILIKQ